MLNKIVCFRVQTWGYLKLSQELFTMLSPWDIGIVMKRYYFISYHKHSWNIEPYTFLNRSLHGIVAFHVFLPIDLWLSLRSLFSIALINKYKPGKCIPLAPATTTTCLQYPITPRKAPRSDNQTKQTNTNRSAEIPSRDPKEIPVRTSHARSRCQQVAWLAAQKVIVKGGNRCWTPTSPDYLL